MRHIFATFSALGQFPEDNDLLKTIESEPHVLKIVALIIEDDCPSLPILLLKFNSFTIFTISDSLVSLN